MADNGQELEPRQARLVLLLADGLTTSEAAERLGISERMARRWRASPDVQEALRAVGRESIRRASSALSALLGVAASALREVASDQMAPPAARVSAAKTIVETALRLREAGELEDRMTALEAKFEEGSSHGNKPLSIGSI